MTKKNGNGKSKFGIHRENAWNKIDEKDISKIEDYAKEYIGFLSHSKTERLAHNLAVEKAKEKGFKNLDEIEDKAETVKPGDKIYRSCMGRTIMLMQVGKRPISEGMHIIGGHIDVPRLDAKPNPLYEDSELSLIDTHYYGGIKKYQWVTIPLAIYGVVVKTDGSIIDIKIGDDKNDPVLTITDLLPHLAKDQVKKSLAVGINGEGLNVLLGSKPLKDSEAGEKVKENILKILNDKYGIVEEDFTSADLHFVPAGDARELGLDRSMIIGYGQDDRICSYAGLKALLDMDKTPEYTSVVLLCDKEEIGSHGATGMESNFFENSVAEVVCRLNKDFNNIQVRRALEKSKMISADVTGAHDPNYPDVSAPNKNMGQLNYGPIFSKYTGSRGKYGASEASAEFMAEIRALFNNAGISWQSAELGKVDGGGGGTIALYMARYGMEVVDLGPGLLSMHSPWEVSSKIDVYLTYKGYKTFLEYDRKLK